MTLIYPPDSKIIIDRGAFIVSRAFEIDGEFHDIIISDGNRALTKENLNLIGESKVRQLAQDIFEECLRSAASASSEIPLENRLFVYKKNFNEAIFDSDKVEMVVHPDGVKHPIGNQKVVELFTELNKYLNAYGKVEDTDGSLEKGDTPSPPEAPVPPTSWTSKAYRAFKAIPKMRAFGGEGHKKASSDGAADKASAKKDRDSVPLTENIQAWIEELSKDDLVYLQQAQGLQWLEESLKAKKFLNDNLREAFKNAILAGIRARISKNSQ